MILPEFPPFVQFETTTLCNSECITCPNRALQGIRPQVMHSGFIEQIVAEMHVFQEHVRTVIPFVHGEPLLYPELIPLIRGISQTVGYNKVEIATNAALLDEQMRNAIEDLLTHDMIRTLVFSVDGYAHFGEVRKGLDRDQVYGNIERFLEQTMYREKLRVDMTVCKSNRSDLPEFAEYWTARGVNWNFSAADGRYNKEESISKGTCLPCRILWESVYILSNGLLAPCCIDWRGDMVLGDLAEHDIHTIWHGERYESMRRVHLECRKPTYELCVNCDRDM